MVKLTKIYTRTGDKGMTHLAGGHRVSKVSDRIAAIGEVDELNAHIGFVISACLDQSGFHKIISQLKQIQNELFNLGSQLAVLHEHRRPNTPVIKYENIARLEKEIDEMNEVLPSLMSFILPGGGEISTRLHLARAVCRRAERTLLHLAQQESLDDIELPFLNRLSDWLFVSARYVSHLTHQPEQLWQP